MFDEPTVRAVERCAARSDVEPAILLAVSGLIGTRLALSGLGWWKSCQTDEGDVSAGSA